MRAPLDAEPRTRPALDRHRILDAALQLVDAQGLEALSMRKLGAALGVEAMALYYHVPNKAALLDGLLELVLDQLEVPPLDQLRAAKLDWAAFIRVAARSFRDLGRAHPNLFALLSTVGFTNPATIRPAEAVLDVLCEAGLDLSTAFVAFVTLKSYVAGHTEWTIADSDLGSRNGQICDALPDFAPEDYPRLATYAREFSQEHVDAEFERGLELIIDGIRARLPGHAEHRTRSS
jgi:TetR/AcrR family transcriptional regulator, tetracycline repressor protein